MYKCTGVYCMMCVVYNQKIKPQINIAKHELIVVIV